jgi:hypothetical protein
METIYQKISPFPSLPKRGLFLPLAKGGQEGFDNNSGSHCEDFNNL